MGNFFNLFFGLEDDDENDSTTTNRQEESRVESEPEVELSSVGTSLQDVENFVAELQSYYFNDLTKMQADLIVNTMTPSHINFVNKKIKQEQIALSQIDEILSLVREKEREYQSVWSKSIYSFYGEIEEQKLSTAQKEVFIIVLRLCSVNTKPELKSVIYNRIKSYKEAWNIGGEIQIPTNYNVVLVDEKDGVEKYQFGEFTKYVIAGKDDKVLSSSQLDKIRAIDFEVDEPFPTNQVWVYVSCCTRLQVNFMRRTCFIDKTWEYAPDEDRKLCLDVVEVDQLDQYLKGVLQIVLAKRTYAVISIVVPTAEMRRIIGPIEEREDRKVEILNSFKFIYGERSGNYKHNLLTARIDRRFIQEKESLVPFHQYKKDNF